MHLSGLLKVGAGSVGTPERDKTAMRSSTRSAQRIARVLLALFYGWIALGAVGLHTHRPSDHREPCWSAHCSAGHEIAGALTPFDDAGTTSHSLGEPFPVEGNGSAKWNLAPAPAANNDFCQACRVLSLRLVSSGGTNGRARLPAHRWRVKPPVPSLPSLLLSVPQCRSPPLAA